MKIFTNLSIRMKILIMLIAPIAGLLYFSVSSVIEKDTVVSELESIQSLAQLAVKASALVHETEKERGATAIFLGSKGSKFVSELPAQRHNTDQKRAELKAFLEGFDSQAYGSVFNAQLSDALNRLSQIDGKRSAVSAQTISGKKAIGYYTDMNGAFLGVIGNMVKLSSNGAITRDISAYVNFLQGKERAGVERAVLSDTFAKDTFGPGMLHKFGTLVAEQDTYAREFQSLASEEAKSYFKAKLQGQAVDEVNRMRQVAFDKGSAGGFGIDASVWFKTVTSKINLLKEVEDWLSEDMVKQVNAQHSQAVTAQVFYITLASTAGILAFVLAFFVARNITGALGQALVALKDIAEGEGDLTRRLDDSGKDEIAQLSGAFNQFAGKIEALVSQIKHTAGSISTGANEIAEGNLDLSSRTEEQASSLEETASSMEEMTSSVKQSADNAKQANQLAVSASDQAEKGGEVVGKAVVAMGEINTASKKIADIISVIDEIAFQTNLLALNAAVEAARAGEQGRGFAVVAGEVRSLAGRSAEAAKEIKGLINDSVEKVNQGSKLVSESGETLEEIVGSVKKVTDIVSEISAASQEQAAGIEQVNKAVMQMDEMTQQNAALVEEAAAASKAMEDQSLGLMKLMNQFKIGDDKGNMMATERKPQQAKQPERRRPERPFSESNETVQPEARAKTGTDDGDWNEF